MKVGLAFSGGKDSWACLLLYKERLSEITVFWVNTGKNYPEMLETIERAKKLCPNFVEVKSDREKQNAEFGIPSEIVPIKWTKLGMLNTSPKPVMVQSYIECCFYNIANPLNQAVHAHGITHLIMGQRNDEGHKSTTRDGDTVFGVKRIHPIETWTKEQVMAFVGDHMDIPEHLHFHHSSMDCYDCTAYQDETQDLAAHAEKKHPDLYAAYTERKNKLSATLKEALHGING